MEDLDRVLVAANVKLVARRPIERPTLVRPDLGRDAEAAQQAERPPCDGRVRDVDVYGDLAATPEVDAAGRVKEPRELRQPVALAPRRDRRELAAQVLRE